MVQSWTMAAADLHLHFVNSAILTVVVSFVVLGRYRQAVLEPMAHGERIRLALSPPRVRGSQRPRVELPAFQC